jgi:serine protease Do
VPQSLLKLSLVTLAAGLAGTTVLPLAAEDPAVREISSVVRQVFDDSRRAIVQVEGLDANGVLRCTGFYIDPLGTIYTLASVAHDVDKVEVIRGGKRLDAEVLVSDPRSGIAILRSEPGEAFLQPSQNQRPDIAAPVILVGYPLDLDVSPGFGLVAGWDRRIGTRYFSTTHLRANVPVMRGQGGAPLLDMDGGVVGIVTSSVDGGSTCYALPIGAAEKLRRDLARHGDVRHGWIGVVVENSPETLEGSQARVYEIDPEAPAGQAGVLPGDIILRVGDTRVRSREDILDASFFLTAGESAQIEVWRDGQKVLLEAEATLHPAARKPTLQAGMELFPVRVAP